MPGLPMTWNVIVANVSTPFAGANVGLFAANLTVPLAAAGVPIFIIGTSKSNDPCVILVTITTLGSNASSNRYESTFVAPVFTTTGTEKLVPDCTGPAGETIRAVPGLTSTDSGSTVQSKEVLVVATPSDTVTVTLYGLPVAAPFTIVPLITAVVGVMPLIRSPGGRFMALKLSGSPSTSLATILSATVAPSCEV